MSYTCSNPILLITFNKFDTTLKMLESIKLVKPKKIYIASDGGRNQKEHQQIVNFRKIMLENIKSWERAEEIEIITLFSEKNLGCKLGPYNAISWFFENESQGIILEDDCLPTISFYHFCDILLERYQNNPLIAIISGIQFCQHYTRNFNQDYFFTKSAHANGWASWRRTWNNVAMEYKDFNASFDDFKDLFISKEEEKFIKKIWEKWKNKGFQDAWDYQFTFHNLRNHTLSISPKINLITNIGLTHKNATHPIYNDFFVELKSFEMSFPLKHPKNITRDKILEKINFNFFKPKILPIRIINKISRSLFKKHIFKI